MRLQVNFNIQGLSVNETIEGDSPADITHKAKLGIASKMGFLAGAFVRSMSDMDFACEVVRRYNSATNSSCVLPSTLDDFIAWAVAYDLAVVEE
ncbi:MAG: hypothetical protein Q7N50_07250 [Armatimonadota bacterium]|nr:hypothetical protein [Armatimonadota bacterium]